MKQQILLLKDLKRYFGGVKALDGTSLAIEKGKITAVIGPNGSGKSTLFNVISQIVNEQAGRIVLDGVDVTDKKDFEIAQAGISRTFQDVRLFRNLTIREHLDIALSNSDERLLFSLFNKEEDRLARIKNILGIVGLQMPLHTYATDLSYGQRKLLDLAVALAKPHKILMLDEPVAGINPKLRQEIRGILKDLNSKGETILLIEHDMNFVMDLADQIYVLDAGKVIASGKPKEIQNDRKVLEAYLGE